MSSDTSVVTVLRVEGVEIDFRVRTTSAGGINDYSITRSFALILLADAGRRAGDYGFSIPKRPLDKELRQPNWYGDKDWMPDHVGRYVSKVEVLARKNVGTEDETTYARLDAAVEETQHMPPLQAENHLATVFHHLVLRVTVTDPRWTEGLAPGIVFGSTAYDVWWDDPLKPSLPDAT